MTNQDISCFFFSRPIFLNARYLAQLKAFPTEFTSADYTDDYHNQARDCFDLHLQQFKNPEVAEISRWTDHSFPDCVGEELYVQGDNDNFDSDHDRYKPFSDHLKSFFRDERKRVTDQRTVGPNNGPTEGPMNKTSFRVLLATSKKNMSITAINLIAILRKFFSTYWGNLLCAGFGLRQNERASVYSNTEFCSHYPIQSSLDCIEQQKFSSITPVCPHCSR